MDALLDLSDYKMMSRKYGHEVTLWCIILQEMHLAKSKDETNSHGYQRCRSLLAGPSFPLRVTKKTHLLETHMVADFIIYPNQPNSQESQKLPKNLQGREIESRSTGRPPRRLAALRPAAPQPGLGARAARPPRRR